MCERGVIDDRGDTDVQDASNAAQAAYGEFLIAFNRLGELSRSRNDNCGRCAREVLETVLRLRVAEYMSGVAAANARGRTNGLRAD